MQDSLLTIIIPVYKVEKYLRRCLDSVVNQTYTNLEIILVDDGSPDNCPQICEEYANKDNRIKVIHQKNQGPSAARNAGLDIASGDYVAFVDSDDWIESDTYEIVLKKIANSNLDLVGFGYVCEYCDKSVIVSMNDNINAFIDDLMLGKEDWSVWRFVYRNAIFSDLRFEAGTLSEDALIISDIFDRANNCGLVVQNLYHYNCENVQSIMHTHNTDDENYVLFRSYIKNAEYCKKYGRMKSYPDIIAKIYRLGIKCYIRNMKNKFLTDGQAKDIMKEINNLDHCEKVRTWDKIKLWSIQNSPRILKIIAYIQK